MARLDLAPILPFVLGCALSTACAEDGTTPGAGGGAPASEAEGDGRPGGGETIGDTCRDASTCEEPPGDCAWAVCVEGACGVAFVDDGALAAGQRAGDCARTVCDGAGGTRVVADEDDPPRVDDTCTVARCEGTEIAIERAPAGTLCGEAGLLTCDVEGRCVGCESAADCGADAACFSRTCDGGICGVEHAPEGTVAGDPIPGDCREDVCDGAGGLSTGAPANDAPADDDNACEGALCRDGTVVETLAEEDTPCDFGGDGGRCDGAGACVVGCQSDAACCPTRRAATWPATSPPAPAGGSRRRPARWWPIRRRGTAG